MKQTANPCVHLGIGIDTARYAHHVSFLDEKKRTAAKAFHFTETADGYQKFRQAFDRPAKKHPCLHLHVHVDAAGQYAENLLQCLHDLARAGGCAEKPNGERLILVADYWLPFQSPIIIKQLQQPVDLLVQLVGADLELFVDQRSRFRATAKKNINGGKVRGARNGKRDASNIVI